MSPFDKFEKIIFDHKLVIKKFDPTKNRPVYLKSGAPMSCDKYREKLLRVCFGALTEDPNVMKKIKEEEFADFLTEYAEDRDLILQAIKSDLPTNFKDLTLNMDISHQGRDSQFFLTTPDEITSMISGPSFLRLSGMKEDEASSIARKVIPDYRPRSKPGVVSEKTSTGEVLDIFNSYIPPEWMSYEGYLPDSLPTLFLKLVRHLFPDKVEREYFYCWLYASLFERAYVYLILCAPGGTGKNRLKLVMRALHGHRNTVDGKRSTFNGTFNSQLAENTLAWFDELTYGLEMENAMKEVQNDSISIEKKGVDATRSTKIYSSLVVSNNKPRDNYIPFDSRKFVPLQVTTKRLDSVMSPPDIEALTQKVENWETYDLKFIAQIGRWIKKHGRRQKWFNKHLEYHGPMFYQLAHTSMSRWQKKAAMILIEDTYREATGVIYDDTRGYKWSTLAERTSKKNGDRSLQFPDFSTVDYFFNIFVDAHGKKTFETTKIKNDIMGDFYVKLINKKAKIVSEAQVATREDVGDDDVDL